MLIKYIHSSEPEKVKIHDTQKALRNNPFIKSTQSKFDEFTLSSFKRDLKSGVVLEFSII